MMEKTIFRVPLSQVWEETQAFWRERGPEQLERAARDPKHRMALVFRWYLGLSSRWANAGEPTRKVDYQVWCGPSMGAFNEWTRGTYLEDWRERRVADVARELMHGACVRTRQHFARLNGEAITEPVRPVGRERLREVFR